MFQMCANCLFYINTDLVFPSPGEAEGVAGDCLAPNDRDQGGADDPVQGGL